MTRRRLNRIGFLSLSFFYSGTQCDNFDQSFSSYFSLWCFVAQQFINPVLCDLLATLSSHLHTESEQQCTVAKSADFGKPFGQKCHHDWLPQKWSSYIWWPSSDKKYPYWPDVLLNENSVNNVPNSIRSPFGLTVGKENFNPELETIEFQSLCNMV